MPTKNKLRASPLKGWRREVDRRAAVHVPMKHLAGLIYLALAPGPGKPRDLVSHIDIKDICTEYGLGTMLKILDREYVRES